MANSLAQTLYPETHTNGKKKPKALTPVAGSSAKVGQQQKPAAKTTKGPQNAAK